MALDLTLLALGVAALYFGAEWLVRGGARLGVSFGLSPMVIGLTVVSLGTSAPELVVCVVAAFNGNPDLAVGNVIGSNLANIGLILGVTALITPLAVAARVVRREVPVMLLITFLAYPLLIDSVVGRIDGIFLLALLTTYLVYLLRSAGEETPEVEQEFRQLVERREERRRLPRGLGPVVAGGPEVRSGGGGIDAGDAGDRGDAGSRGGSGGTGAGIPVAEGALSPEELAAAAKGTKRVLLKSVGLVAIGAVALMIGGRMIVTSATSLAETFGLSELFIGLTLVAVGTSLPEMATSVVAAVRREADIAVGNVIGSNIFNLTAVLGTAAVIEPIDVAASILVQEYPAMLLLSLFLLPVAWTANRIRRWEGIFLIGVYVGALWWLFK